MTDDEFLSYLTRKLAALPTVRAVALGGSRAQGTHTPASDWDVAVYYRGPFDPADLRALGWPGQVCDIGGWGGGVFNGGAWLTVDGRRVDVHYRDLDVVERILAESLAGRFHIEPLMFHLAGIPSYLLLAELAVNQVLHGTLPRPEYPEPLRIAAAGEWHWRAAATLGYARAAYPKGCQVTELAGALALAAAQTAHGVLAARGEWVTNEKRLLRRAGLRGLDEVLSVLTPDPQVLAAAVDAAERLFQEAVSAG
jgi:hypothetical protein